MRRYSPLEFIYAFMTRTGRMSDQRLSAQYPELFAQFERAGVLKGKVGSHEKSGHTA